MATTIYIIPLTPEPQAFGITLAGRELRLTLRWLEVDEGGWVLDIHEPESAAAIVCGIPLVGGVDLLEPYEYLSLGGELRISSDLPPTMGNLGDGVDLLFIIPEGSEVDA